MGQRPVGEEASWRLLMERCASSGGIFTAAEVRQAGIDLQRLRRKLDTGFFVREFRGVYRLAGCALGVRERALLATLGTGGVASHQTAAYIWGFEELEEQTTHVTVQHGAKPPRRPLLQIHETRRSLDRLTVTRSGVAVTKPMCTVLDVAAQPIDDKRLEGFVGHCLAERLFTVRALEQFLAPGHPTGRPRLLRLSMFGCAVDSKAEGELVRILVDSGIERPQTQFVVRSDGRFVARVDVAWPAHRVALELDGYRYHSDVQAFVSDRQRGNLIVAAGWTLLRTTPLAVRQDPTGLCRTVLGTLGRASVA